METQVRPWDTEDPRNSSCRQRPEPDHRHSWGPKAPAGHPLGARPPPPLKPRHRLTPELGSSKSRVTLSAPDLVFFLGLVFVDFFKNEIGTNASLTCECKGSGKRAPHPGLSGSGTSSVHTFQPSNGTPKKRQM